MTTPAPATQPARLISGAARGLPARLAPVLDHSGSHMDANLTRGAERAR
jgi:hypothetical protein